MKTTPEIVQVFKYTITFNQLPFFPSAEPYVSKRSDILKLIIRLKRNKKLNHKYCQTFNFFIKQKIYKKITTNKMETQK